MCISFLEPTKERKRNRRVDKRKWKLNNNKVETKKNVRLIWYKLKNNIWLGHFFYCATISTHANVQWIAIFNCGIIKTEQKNIFLLQIVWLLICKVVIFKYFAPENWENVIIGHDDSTKIIMLIYSSLHLTHPLVCIVTQKKTVHAFKWIFYEDSTFQPTISIHRLGMFCGWIFFCCIRTSVEVAFPLNRLNLNGFQDEMVVKLNLSFIEMSWAMSEFELSLCGTNVNEFS